MIVNLIVIFLILIFGFVYSQGSNQDSDSNRKKYIRLICFILILQSGLRNVAVGADTYTYFEYFESSLKTSWGEIFTIFTDYYKYGIGKDPGYLVFEKLCSSISDSFVVYLLIIALIFFSALGNFIYKNTTRLNDIVLAFLIYSVLFYAFFSITGLRQTIATAIALFSYELIKKRKIVQFVLLILIASTIHRSVLVFIPFYFIVQIKNTQLFYKIILFFFPVFMILRNEISGYIKLVGGYEDYEQFEGSGTYTFTAVFLGIAIIAMARSKIILKNNPNAQHYYNAFAIALLFLPLTWINPSTMRIVQYFSVFMLLFIPEIIYSFRTISNKVRIDLFLFTIVLLIALFVKSNITNESDYSFFWEEIRLGEAYLLNN